VTLLGVMALKIVMTFIFGTADLDNTCRCGINTNKLITTYKLQALQ
jgi:hypothetical protein